MSTIEEVARAQEQTVEHRKIWDLPVRVFHWSLVAAIVGAFVTNKLGVSYFKYHLWCGYAVIVLVAFRIAWGFVGTRHALFMNFLRGPIPTLSYVVALLRGLRPHYVGHNPLGAWMVVALLIGLAAQASSGLFATDDIFNAGPFYGAVGKNLGEALTSIHRRLFYWIAGAIAIHVLAVAAHQLLHREKLVQAMFTGRKPHWWSGDDQSIRSSRLWLAALLACVAAGALAFVVAAAPSSAGDDLY
ncbi:cytochrome b/b6 domain-containing protein [Methylocapsa acidiphila]|uniref:cytochrome b/b6 domain-containing protein n=1 Tax=Methylocapsa acidiphila TaxID=133552 RepID=UPI0004080789|nr:cytochrome b/b6 domain-containing protein [Methylocapsa acidiphila]